MIERKYIGSVSIIERCDKCKGFREKKVYENGCMEKTVYRPTDIKCKHKWRLAKQEEI